MLSNFDKVFEEMIHKRVYELEEVMLKDKEHDKLSEKFNQLYVKIKENLPEEHKKLISELEAIMKKAIYEQGLRDGIELKNILKLVI